MGIIVKGRSINGQRSQKKYDFARRMMQMDYCEISSHSNMFVMMDRFQENKWERETISQYYDNFTASQLEKMIEIRTRSNMEN